MIKGKTFRPFTDQPPSGGFCAFAGHRSIAWRDHTDRLFTPRDKERAGRFRNALREARDAQAMLAVSRDILAAVERLAGADRADAIRERLAKLLPESVAQSA